MNWVNIILAISTEERFEYLGFSGIICACLTDYTPWNAKDNYNSINYCDMNFALILCAEHTGVSKSLIKESDFLIKIPILKDFNSLNVSNALSAIIFETVRQKIVNGK